MATVLYRCKKHCNKLWHWCLCLLIPQLAGAQFRPAAPINSVYQYHVAVGAGAAYLWVPPACKQVRGAIISFANLLENNWLNDPIIRETANANNLAIIAVTASPNGLTPELTPAGIVNLFKMLKDLAYKSGYTEIEHVALIPIDHSIHGVFTWNMASKIPQRTIAVIPVKTLEIPPFINLHGVPLCYIVGENDEWPPAKDGKPWQRDFIWHLITQSAQNLLANQSQSLVAVVTDPGGGHLDWSAKLSTFMALYIAKACKYRLPKRISLTKPATLIAVNKQSGYLTDAGGLDKNNFAAAPYARYRGNVNQAYWYFDAPLARAAVRFCGTSHTQKPQMMTFVSNGMLQPFPRGFVELNCLADSNGVFTTQAAFLPKVPAAFRNGEDLLGHSTTPTTFKVVAGPAIQTDSNEFRLQLNRFNTWGDVWIQAQNRGDSNYKPAVQPAQVKLFDNTTQLQPACLVFFKPHDVVKGTKAVKLEAISNTGANVNFFVVSGAAYISGNKLVLSPVPVKTSYPLQVTVAAYQLQKLNNGLFAPGAPVYQTFNIVNKR